MPEGRNVIHAEGLERGEAFNTNEARQFVGLLKQLLFQSVEVREMVFFSRLLVGIGVAQGQKPICSLLHSLLKNIIRKNAITLSIFFETLANITIFQSFFISFILDPHYIQDISFAIRLFDFFESWAKDGCKA